MFKLIKFALSAVFLAGGAYFAAKVPLGNKTLFEHVQAIAESKESQALVEGVKKKAQEAINPGSGTSEQTSAADAGVKPVVPNHAPAGNATAARERMTESDRRELRRVINSRLNK